MGIYPNYEADQYDRIQMTKFSNLRVLSWCYPWCDPSNFHYSVSYNIIISNK